MVPISVLDLAPIVQGGNASSALKNTLDLAQLAEELGFRRYWLAEHHSMPGIASAATSVVIGYVAGGTSTIRVGAGGIMLPNHAPFLIAEQFGTLAALYPNRIDLGVGRAPGSDMLTQRALRRMPDDAKSFPDDVVELMGWFRPARPDQAVQAVPGAGAQVPIWMLGSSLFGAELAASLGLPYAFASHFAPGQMMSAIALYRSRFRPSEALKEPYVMLGLNVIAADHDEEARVLFTSLEQAFVNLRRGHPGHLPAPDPSFPARISEADRMMLDHALSCSLVGSKDSVREGLRAFIARTRADELMITAQIHDHQARRRSLSLVRAAWQELT
jgi:luciferase family oxidoreductase group 1